MSRASRLITNHARKTLFLTAILTVCSSAFGQAFCNNTSFSGTSITCVDSNIVEGGAGGTVSLSKAFNAHDTVYILCESTSGSASAFTNVKITIGGTDYFATSLSTNLHWNPASAPVDTDQEWWVADTGSGTSGTVSCGSTGENIYAAHLRGTGSALTKDAQYGLTATDLAPATPSQAITTTSDGDLIFSFVNWNNFATAGTGFTALDTNPQMEAKGQSTHGSVSGTWSVSANDHIVMDTIAFSTGGAASPKGSDKRRKLDMLEGVR